jgi:hypothetical protein
MLQVRNNISHASGGYGKDVYLNSTGNILMNIERGFQNIEVDIMLSDDNKAAICLHNKHDFKRFFGFTKSDILLNYDTFKLLSDSHPNYDFCHGDVLLDIFTSYPDVNLILDLKNNYESKIYANDRYKVLEIIAGVHHLNMNNVVPQIYDLNHETVFYLESLGYTKFLLALQVLTNTSDSRGLSAEVAQYIQWLKDEDKLDMIHGISIPLSVVYDYKETLLKFLVANNIAYYPHTTNSIEEVNKLHDQLDITGVYTDYLPPFLEMLKSDCTGKLNITTINIDQVNFDKEYLSIANKSDEYCILDGFLLLNTNNHVLFNFSDGSYIAPDSVINIHCFGERDTFYSYVGEVEMYSQIKCGEDFLLITEGDNIIKLVNTLPDNPAETRYSIVDTGFYSIIQHQDSSIKLKYTCDNQQVMYDASATPIPVPVPVPVDVTFNFKEFSYGMLTGATCGAFFTIAAHVDWSETMNNLLSNYSYNLSDMDDDLYHHLSSTSPENLRVNKSLYPNYPSYLGDAALEHEFGLGVIAGFLLGVASVSIGCEFNLLGCSMDESTDNEYNSTDGFF